MKRETFQLKKISILIIVLLFFGVYFSFFIKVSSEHSMSVPTDYFDDLASIGFTSKYARIRQSQDEPNQLIFEWDELDPRVDSFYISGEPININNHDAKRVQTDVLIGGAYNQGSKSDNYDVKLYLRSFSQDGSVLTRTSIPIKLSSIKDRARLYSVSIPVSDEAVSYQTLIRIGKSDTAISAGFLTIANLDLIER